MMNLTSARMSTIGVKKTYRFEARKQNQSNGMELQTTVVMIMLMLLLIDDVLPIASE